MHPAALVCAEPRPVHKRDERDRALAREVLAPRGVLRARKADENAGHRPLAGDDLVCTLGEKRRKVLVEAWTAVAPRVLLDAVDPELRPCVLEAHEKGHGGDA